jgi:hypothetical protein
MASVTIREDIPSDSPVAGKRRKIIVGLDFGTTNSGKLRAWFNYRDLRLRSIGFSYVTSDETYVDKIEVNKIWDYGGNLGKAPSAIAYAVDNPDEKFQTEIKWGFEAQGLNAYVWTKLLLGKDSRSENVIDTGLRDLYGDKFMNTPPGKGPKEVVTDYLTGLYACVETRLKARSEVAFQLSPLEIWVTVPAMWTDAAKNATREAVLAAGFGSRPSDTVNVISEPEAAALTVMTQRTGLGALTELEVSGCLSKIFSIC